MEMNEKPDLVTLFLFVIHQYRRNCIERATISVVAELCRRNNNITTTKGKTSLSVHRSGSAAILPHCKRAGRDSESQVALKPQKGPSTSGHVSVDQEDPYLTLLTVQKGCVRLCQERAWMALCTGSSEFFGTTLLWSSHFVRRANTVFRASWGKKNQEGCVFLFFIFKSENYFDIYHVFIFKCHKHWNKNCLLL